jgi:hypothetical protein
LPMAAMLFHKNLEQRDSVQTVVCDFEIFLNFLFNLVGFGHKPLVPRLSFGFLIGGIIILDYRPEFRVVMSDLSLALFCTTRAIFFVHVIRNVSDGSFPKVPAGFCKVRHVILLPMPET